MTFFIPQTLWKHLILLAPKYFHGNIYVSIRDTFKCILYISNMDQWARCHPRKEHAFELKILRVAYVMTSIITLLA